MQVQKHEIEFLLPEASNGLCSRTDHHSNKAYFVSKMFETDPAGPDRRRPLTPLVGLACLGVECRGQERIS